MKTLFRYVLAATLAVTVYSFSNGGSSENAVVLDDPTDSLYRFVEPHDLAGDTMTRQEIADEKLCPSGPQLCATSVNGLSDPILWSGPTTKF